MTARRVSEKHFSIPPNPQYLEFERSDGDPSRWPSDVVQIIDSEGQVNFMKPVGLEDGPAMRWRLGVAQGLATGLELPVGPTYIIRSWPAGYSFYDHHKGRAENPRHDLYLIGSKMRYRSVNEFIPHALWLMQDPTLNEANCLCKYCQKTSQKDVHASMAPGILSRPHGVQSPPPSRFKAVRSSVKLTRAGSLKDRPPPDIFATVQKIPGLPKSPNVHPKYTMPVERHSDLRSISSRNGMRLKRWHRIAELLWCALDHPILSPRTGTSIQYWPGIVHEVKLNSIPVPLGDTSCGNLLPHLHLMTSRRGDDDFTNKSEPMPWRVHQSSDYRIHLLAIGHSLLVSDDRVIPYQAYAPPLELIEELRQYHRNGSSDRNFTFNPYKEEEPLNFEDSVSPYLTAVRISENLSSSWALSDEWCLQYSQAQSSELPSPATFPPYMQQANTSGNQHQVAPGTHLNLCHVQECSPSISAASGDHTPFTSQTGGGDVGSGNLSQTRFQGLWWGPERIWTDDFIRLKLARRNISPKGGDHIFPPSGPGRYMRDDCLNTGMELGECGAGSRGVFMRLDALIVVDVEDGSATRKECRVCGMLYELADADWEDPGNGNILKINNTGEDLPVTKEKSVLSESISPPTETVSYDSLSKPPGFSHSISQLSRPAFPHYFSPEAPDGYVLRPILSKGYEAVMSLSLISGRYYPRILSHPLLADAKQQALSKPGSVGACNLWALEGLSAGIHNSIDPRGFRQSRLQMVSEATKSAIEELENERDRAVNCTMVNEESISEGFIS